MIIKTLQPLPLTRSKVTQKMTTVKMGNNPKPTETQSDNSEFFSVMAENSFLGKDSISDFNTQ